MYIKKIVSFILVFILLCSVTMIKPSALSEKELTAPSAILIEPTTKKVLFEHNSHEKRPCASVTKVMTLLLIMEAIEEGKITYEEMVTSSQRASSMGGSDIWLEEGEQMSVDDMVKAIVVASANDASVAMAEHICGTEEEFINKMNQRAKELGMNDTTFKNCNGLDEEGHITSAYDVALMSAELIKHEKIFEYTKIWIDYLRDGETQIVNTNKLLKTYTGITGLKTGTTGDAGSCISATAQRNSMSLVAVVLGATTGTERFKDAATLLDFGFANFETIQLDADCVEFPEIEVKDGMKKNVKVSCSENLTLVVKKGTKEKTEQELKLKDSLNAPVKKGDKAGELIFSLGDKKIAEFDVVTTQDVEKISFSSVFAQLLNAVITL